MAEDSEQLADERVRRELNRLADERVRRELNRLAADAASAPDVPPAVTARIVAALRSASPPPAHAARTIQPRVVALVVGIGAVLTAAVIGIAVALHKPAATNFPTGPTAETMTVPATPSDTPGRVATPP